MFSFPDDVVIVHGVMMNKFGTIYRFWACSQLFSCLQCYLNLLFIFNCRAASSHFAPRTVRFLNLGRIKSCFSPCLTNSQNGKSESFASFVFVVFCMLSL